MDFEQLFDLQEIEEYLRKDVYLHIYGIGDLDEFFRQYTTWYGWRSDGDIIAVVLLYRGPSLPTVLALSRDTEPMAALLHEIAPDLPDEFYAHVSPGAEQALEHSHALHDRGLHYKMALRNADALHEAACDSVVPLKPDDVEELLAFYGKSYPESWFDPRMLETGRYYGAREDGQLVSAAGIHVYSSVFRVAALGNIATLPSHRSRGYGRAVTAQLCRSLLQTVDHIGLNVKADNTPAIACYKGLGFTEAASYGEFVARKM